tara:strand:- start:75 stop:395 length:321 start_codon:yes stop_codon:yes gene_type:complete
MKLEVVVDFPENSEFIIKEKDNRNFVNDVLCSLIGDYKNVNSLRSKMAPLDLSFNQEYRDNFKNFDFDNGAIIGSPKCGYSLAIPRKGGDKNNYLTMLRIELNTKY